MTKQEKARLDKRIERIYGLRCGGMQIDIFDIPKVYDAAYRAVERDRAARGSDQVLGDYIEQFVLTIRRWN
jgi:hypothetical protein